jgi:hypothetical protein
LVVQARAWNNSIISLRIEDPRTLIFKRQNMEVHEEVVVRVVHDRYMLRPPLIHRNFEGKV